MHRLVLGFLPFFFFVIKTECIAQSAVKHITRNLKWFFSDGQYLSAAKLISGPFFSTWDLILTG